MNAGPIATTRLELPRPGGAVSLVVFGSIVVFFVGVAVFNLWHSAALSPLAIGASVLWLCIVSAVLLFAIADAGGVRPFLASSLINALGTFARRAFLEVGRGVDGSATLRYGFESFGRAFDYSTIELARIGEVSWGAGQASAMSGHDRNDWCVAVWYWKPGCGGRWERRNVQDRYLIIVTPYLPKKRAAEIGRSVVALLSDAGVHLVPSEEENKFVIAESAHKPLSPKSPDC